MSKLADNIEKQTESIMQQTQCITNQTRLWDRMDARLEVIEKRD